LDELKFLRAQVRETEEALQSAQLRAELEANDRMAKAYAEGLELGQQEGRRAGYEAFDKKAKAFAEMIESAVLLQRQVLETTEDRLVEIVMAAVCGIIGESLANESSVRVLLRETLDRAQGAKIGRIRVNPSDYRLIAELPAHDFNGSIESVEFLPDETIKIGGCVLESDAGTLDCRLDAQLEQLKALLLLVRNSHE
jgi:flagellar assembly protein FliH